jgi:hypothetical protein
MESLTSGTLAGTGSFRCDACGYVVALAAGDRLPPCPGCGATGYSRASLFGISASRRPMATDESQPAWLEDVRREIANAGEHLVYEESDRTIVVPLTREWTRIGRSLAADVRFDDPTVSRRHALVVRQPDGVRVLDDRSLNGVFVNGERVEWSVLRDGDEIVVGRYTIYFIGSAQSQQAGDKPGRFESATH